MINKIFTLSNAILHNGLDNDVSTTDIKLDKSISTIKDITEQAIQALSEKKIYCNSSEENQILNPSFMEFIKEHTTQALPEKKNYCNPFEKNQILNPSFMEFIKEHTTQSLPEKKNHYNPFTISDDKNDQTLQQDLTQKNKTLPLKKNSPTFSWFPPPTVSTIDNGQSVNKPILHISVNDLERYLLSKPSRPE